MNLFEEFKIYEHLWEDVLTETEAPEEPDEVEAPIENDTAPTEQEIEKHLPNQLAALVNQYNENVTRQVRWNYIHFDRMATKLPRIVDVTAEYDAEAGCYDIVFHFSRKVYKPQVAKIFHVMFIANRFHRNGKFSGSYEELLDYYALDRNKISLWQGRLRNMGIRTGLRDKKIK